jgi:hypothetical protein
MLLISDSHGLYITICKDVWKGTPNSIDVALKLKVRSCLFQIWVWL